MAYLSSSITNLTLEISHIPCSFVDPSPASNPFSLNFSSSRSRLISFPLKSVHWLRSSTVVKNTSKPEAFAEPERIAHVPLLSLPEAIDGLKRNQGRYTGKQQFLAMYSSIFEGITTDTAAMVIPMDDHMVHRGHGVFDTTAIMDGYIYELDQHLDRFIGSATMAKIKLPFDRESIRRILIQTVSASKCRRGKEGPIAEALLNLILEDMKSGPPSVRDPVPY